jgi:hypothetical protein
MLAQDVARRAIRDAYRNGLDIDELIEAVRFARQSQLQREAR